MAGSGKEDLRVAAERLQRGIERLDNGDLAGALVDFEAVLKMYSDEARGPHFTAWIQKVQLAMRVAPLDEDALHGIEAALSPSAMEDTKPERKRRGTPLPGAMTERGLTPPERERRLTPPPVLSSAAAPLRASREHAEGESPWDPVPLTPGGSEQPRELRDERRADRVAEMQSAETKAAPPPIRPGQSSSTMLGMPPLEPKLLTPQKRRKVHEDRPESVTREFRPTTPTNPNMKPLDVPELTDEQIQGLLSLDSPLLKESKTTPEIELDRIDTLDESPAERLIELEAVPTPIPAPPPKPVKNDTNPMGVHAFEGEFEGPQLTPTGVKPMGLKAVRPPDLDDLDEDPYADLNLLPLEVAPDLSGPDEVEEGGTNPTNPFIRGTHAKKLAELNSAGADVKLEDMPPLPTLPGTRGPTPLHPLGVAEAALQAGDLAKAVDACEAALAPTGGLAGDVARDHLPLVEQIYGAILGGADRVPVHGKPVADLEPRSAFLLSRLDGSMTVEDVLDVSGMPRLEALRTMALLVRRGAVVIK